MPEFSYRRSIPVEEGYDLVVAGGGPAGCAAAICAGRLGAKVLLVEGQGCLGGTGTSGLVTEFDPMANGEQMVVGGLMREIIETLYARGYVPELLSPKRWRQEAMKWTPFDAEGLKLLLDELAAEAGVEVRFFTRAIDVDMSADGARVNGVVLSNIEGLRYVRAKAFVDATGDAMLAKLAGFPCYEAGKDNEHIMPPTLCALFSGIDWRALQPGDIGLPHHQEKIEQAIADGFFSQNDRHVPGMMMNTGDVGSMNSDHVFGVDALNCRSLSDGMARGRKLVQAIRKGCTCTQVDTAELVETLRSQGANLPQETLSHTMTRGK